MKELSEFPDLLTVQEVCGILRVGRRAVYQYINDHTLLSRKMAGKYRIPKFSVMKFIDEMSADLHYNNVGDGSDALNHNG